MQVLSWPHIKLLSPGALCSRAIPYDIHWTQMGVMCKSDGFCFKTNQMDPESLRKWIQITQQRWTGITKSSTWVSHCCMPRLTVEKVSRKILVYRLKGWRHDLLDPGHGGATGKLDCCRSRLSEFQFDAVHGADIRHHATKAHHSY